MTRDQLIERLRTEARAIFDDEKSLIRVITEAADLLEHDAAVLEGLTSDDVRIAVVDKMGLRVETGHMHNAVETIIQMALQHAQTSVEGGEDA